MILQLVFFFSRLILEGASNPISYHITYMLTYILYSTSYNCRRSQTVVVVMFVDDEEGDVAVIVRYILEMIKTCTHIYIVTDTYTNRHRWTSSDRY